MSLAAPRQGSQCFSYCLRLKTDLSDVSEQLTGLSPVRPRPTTVLLGESRARKDKCEPLLGPAPSWLGVRESDAKRQH